MSRTVSRRPKAPETERRASRGPGARPRAESILAGRHREDVARFVVLRAALLALPGVEERVVEDVRGWTLAFRAHDREILRTRMASHRAGGPGLKVVLTCPAELAAGVVSAEDLRPATRRRLRRVAGADSTWTLPVGGEEDLAETVGLAMTVATRLVAAP